MVSSTLPPTRTSLAKRGLWGYDWCRAYAIGKAGMTDLCSLKSHGWTIIEGFASQDECEEIKKTVELRFSDLINSNRPAATVTNDGAVFNTTVLASSRSACKLVTSDKVIDIATRFIVNGTPVLKCVRSYALKRRIKAFPWHRDNKSALTGKLDHSKGLVFVVFLEDRDCSFSIIEDSVDDSDSAIASKALIEKWKHQQKIRNIQAHRGDCLVFSQSLYHKQECFSKEYQCYMWFQVIGSEDGHTEATYVNTSYIELSSVIKSYLGFGKSITTGYTNPQTSAQTLNVKFALRLALTLIPMALTGAVMHTKQKLLYTLKYNLGHLLD